MVVPEIKDLPLVEVEDRHSVAQLGTLEKDKTSRYILDLSLPKRPDGKFKLLDVEITFDTGSGVKESSGLIPIEMSYTAAGNGYINAEVAKHIDEVQIFELNKNLHIPKTYSSKALKLTCKNFLGGIHLININVMPFTIR